MSIASLKKEVLLFLDYPDTEFLYDRAEETEDAEVLLLLVKKAKRIWAQNLSEADQIINQLKQKL